MRRCIQSCFNILNKCSGALLYPSSVYRLVMASSVALHFIFVVSVLL